MAKSILKIEYDYDFLLFAIVSSAKDYRLCWHLNQLFEFNFTKQKDLEINLPKKKRLAYFSNYLFLDEANLCEYYLIGNKFSGGNFIPELKEADFLFLLKGEHGSLNKSDFLEKIKSLPVVQTVFEVNVKKLKSKQNLIF